MAIAAPPCSGLLARGVRHRGITYTRSGAGTRLCASVSVGNIGVRQRTISSGAFLREATRTLIQIVALQPGAEPEALARALRAYTRSTGYFMACARKDAMRHDLDGRAVEPVSEEHRTGAVKAVQGRRRRSSGQKRVGDAAV